MMEFGERLRRLRLQNNMTLDDIAKYLGVQRPAIYKYEHGLIKNPRRSTILKLAKMFNVSPAYLLGIDGSNATPTQTAVKIPVLGTVVAGIPMETVENIIGYEEVAQAMAAQGELFALRVEEHSMEPRICEGDVVIVRKQPDVESGDIAIVLVDGSRATVKRVKKTEDGITLIANNVDMYAPHFYTNREIQKLPVQVIGKVVELRGKL